MTSHMYIYARLKFVSHFDFPLFSGQIYRVDHGRGNDFDETDSDTLGVGASCGEDDPFAWFDLDLSSNPQGVVR